MDSPELEKFHKCWSARYILMKTQHDEELASLEGRAQKERQHAKKDAEDKLRDLRNNPPTKLAELSDQDRKIKDQRDAALKSIDEHYAQRMCIVKKSQLAEEENYNQGYAQAQANRSLVDSAPPDNHASVDTPMADVMSVTTLAESKDVPETRHCEGVNNSTAGPTVQELTDPSNNQVLSVESAVSTPAALPEQRSESVLPERGFSATVQPLQKVLQPQAKHPRPDTNAVEPIQSIQHVKPAIQSPPAPIPTDSDATAQTADRTITFNEVYQDGQAPHKDKIVEYPVGSRQWYILKCEKHTVHFKQVALRGAAKHLDSLSHGNLGRNRALAIKLLGYRVIDCNEELAAQNNKVVDEAFANGYEPENRLKSKKWIPYPKLGAPMLEIQAPKPKQSPSNTSPEVITDPKPFHVYQCFWSQNKCYYPVIILGWDDQTAGGLDTNLAGTGLLDKKVSNPPNCYVYKDIDSKTHAAIVGWSPQYEDGGSKIKQRKFPVKFFDRASNVGWVSARTLSKFPLFQASSAAKKEFHNAARRYIAKREGFSSWESFEATRKGIIQAPETEVVTPEVSPLTATYEFNEDSGTDDCLQSSQSSNSNITQKELAEIRDTAGEIEGDDDYFESDVDSTLDEEFDWDQPGANGRPWASYHLRADDCAPHNTNTNTEVLPRECPETECTQEIASSVKDGSSLQSECQNIYTKGIIENDDTNKPSDNSPAPDTDTASIGNRSASSPKQAEWPAPCLLAKDARLVTESSLGPLVQSPSSYVSGHARLIAPEVIENKERLKRARCEENLGLEIGTPKPEDAKRIRLETEPPKSQVERSMPVVLQPQPTPQPSPPAVQPFVAYTTSGTDKFELSKYRKGLISWERGDDKLCLELWYQEDRKRVGTVDGTLNIVIDPVMLRGFVKGEIKGEKGNNFVTLLPRDTNDEPIELAFDRSEDGKNVIGNVQARRFWYWMRGVVPSLPLLTSSELNW